MHLAKGLEFRAVVVAACDDAALPSQARIERVGDPAELDEVYTAERHLLYVACTRARDHLLVARVEPASESSTTCWSSSGARPTGSAICTRRPRTRLREPVQRRRNESCGCLSSVLNELCDGQSDVSGDSLQENGGNIAPTVNRDSSCTSISMAKLFVRTTLAHFFESRCYEDGDHFAGLEDGRHVRFR